jgi:hypothetical protein
MKRRGSDRRNRAREQPSSEEKRVFSFFPEPSRAFHSVNAPPRAQHGLACQSSVRSDYSGPLSVSPQARSLSWTFGCVRADARAVPIATRFFSRGNVENAERSIDARGFRKRSPAPRRVVRRVPGTRARRRGASSKSRIASRPNPLAPSQTRTRPVRPKRSVPSGAPRARSRTRSLRPPLPKRRSPRTSPCSARAPSTPLNGPGTTPSTRPSAT